MLIAESEGDNKTSYGVVLLPSTTYHPRHPTSSLLASTSTEDATGVPNPQGPHHPIPGVGSLLLPFPSFQEIKATMPFGIHSANLLLFGQSEAQRRGWQSQISGPKLQPLETASQYHGPHTL